MASVLQVATIKDSGGNANAIEIANSSANVTINNLAAGTIGDAIKPILEYDEWVLTANKTGDNSTVTSWSRNANNGFDKIGTGLSETSSNSGIFYFPKTGYYRIDFTAHTQHINDNDSVGNLSINHIPDLSSAGTSHEIIRIQSPFIATNFQSLNSNFTLIKVTTSGSSGQGFKLVMSSMGGSNELLGNSRDTKFSIMRLGGV